MSTTMKISEILKTYETDKANGHCYGDSYDELFSVFDKQAPLNILEIGTQKGGSLCAWQDYFPNAKVVGIDIVDVVKPEYRRDTIKYIVKDVKEVVLEDDFDIIIDDGSHMLRDALFVVNNFYPHLKKGGVMVIEDVQNPPLWTQSMPHPYQIKDMRDVKGNYDDFLIILKR